MDEHVYEDLDAIPDFGFQVVHAIHGGAAILARARYPEVPMVFCCLGLEGRDLPPSVDANVGALVVATEDVRTALERMGLAEGPVTVLDPSDPAGTLIPAYAQAIEGFRARPLPGGVPVRELASALDEMRDRVTDAEGGLRARLAELERRAGGGAPALAGAHGAAPPSSGLRRVVDRVAPWGTRRRTVLLAPVRGLRAIRREGLGATLRGGLAGGHRGPAPVGTPAWDQRYAAWERTRLSRGRLRAMAREAAALQPRPTISVIMPTYDSDPAILDRAIRSVRDQLYDRWELCIADDGSTRPETVDTVRAHERQDPRIRSVVLPENRGIAAASNAALGLAGGEFVGFLDHDEELKPDALFQVARLLADRPDLDYVFSDEDKKDPDGRPVEAFFKPGWSPDLLLSVNYVTHFSVYRRALVERVGGFREGFEGSQDYDLVLRATEATDRVAHLPLPLYSWRKVPGSAAASLDHKDYAYESGRRALEDALRRRGVEAKVEEALTPGRYRVRYQVSGTARVSVIVPTRDRAALLRRCIGSVRRRTTYPTYEILIVDNDSTDPETLAFLEAFDGRILRYPGDFDYAAMMNAAAEACADSDHLLFLNNDTEVITEDWITAMVEHGQREEVGAVGARLLFPDGRPQHEGIVLGYRGGVAGNVDHQGYFDLGETVRNCSAVTGACMLVRSARFRELGGFDERLGVVYNDVDLCLRAMQAGYLNVYTPYALLYHAESSSRRDLHPTEDERFFIERWGEPGASADPYYNPNLSLTEPFTIGR
jgi:GT2 family glycosyltransferase